MEEDTVFITSKLVQEKLQYPKQPLDGGKVLTTRRDGPRRLTRNVTGTTNWSQVIENCLGCTSYISESVFCVITYYQAVCVCVCIGFV